MADPAVVPCAANAVVEVATNVTSITPRFLSFQPKGYAWTYVSTGGTKPTDTSQMVQLRDGETLSFSAAADVFVVAQGEAGSLRVDS